jgi:hypothetical protein
MASLTMDDIDELWTAMREDKSWRRMKDVLDYRPPEAIGRSLTDDLLDAVRTLQDRRFPASKRDLYDLLKQELR